MLFFIFFFFNDTATTEIYTLSLHDALPISRLDEGDFRVGDRVLLAVEDPGVFVGRSEEHTSELQSQSNLVCRLLLEKKKRTRPVSCNRSPNGPSRRCGCGGPSSVCSCSILF